MTIKECYEKVGSDYDGVLKRLGSEALVKRFAVKFLNDPSFQELVLPHRMERKHSVQPIP